METQKKPVYHVVIQGVYQIRAFGEDLDKEMYWQRILRYKQILRLQLYAFCIFDNHAHFLLRGTEAEISSLMRRVGVSYAHWYRREHYHEGGLFRGRPRMECLEEEGQILRVARFIHQEPVQKGLVDRMDGYPWCSYWMYQRADSPIDCDEITERLRFWGRFEEYMAMEEQGHYLEEQPVRFGYSDEEVLQRVEKRLAGRPLIELQVMPRELRNYILALLRYEDRISILQLARVTGLGRGVIQRIDRKDLRLTLYSDTCIIHSEDTNKIQDVVMSDYPGWRNTMTEQTVFRAGNILLPRNCDYSIWSTIACDQFTSDPEYWERVRMRTEGQPSCYHITLPEIYLQEGEEALAGRIRSINRTMQQYLQELVLKELPDAMIYVERTLSDGRLRRGLMGLVDLEAYDYSKGSGAYIRATEETVLERIPPRVQIRKDAPMELPHLMLLVDDEQRYLIEPLEEQKSSMECCYDFDLMEDSGHIRGYLLTEQQQDRILRVLNVMADPAYFAGKYKTDGPVLLFAVGDGNHSLATAKECYEQLKRRIGPEKAKEHPARYALAEIVNLHDESLEFEPIYRVVFGADTQTLLAQIVSEYPGAHEGEPSEGEVCIDNIAGDQEGRISIPTEPGRLPVSLLQPVLDQYLSQYEGHVDYIHGLEEAKALGRKQGNLAFIFKGMRKDELFPGIIAGGVLPRKTFSMGVSRDKRFYLEGRLIR